MKEKEMVAVVIPTYRRFNELKRCLACIDHQTRKADFVVVVDNDANAATQELVEKSGEHFRYLPMPENIGCGAALKAGEKYIFEKWKDQVSHIWIMDDDAAPEPKTLEQLLEAANQTSAAIIAPICTAPDGTIFGLPDTVKLAPRKIRKSFKVPQDIRNYYKERLIPIRWCVGTSILVKAWAIKESGLHRDDFWMQGEDMEFSMRICRTYGGVWDTWTTMPHLFPPGLNGETVSWAYFSKFCSVLQNMAYIVFHETRSLFNWYCLAVIYRRFFMIFGWRFLTFKYALITFWNGVFLAEPAGQPSGKKLRMLVNIDAGKRAIK